MENSQHATDPLYLLLREGLIDEFNRRRAAGEPCQLRGSDLSHADLRKLVADGLDLRDCRLHSADLRGMDLRQVNLQGASVMGARISDTWFPQELSAEEINLSLVHGTRLRYR